MNLKVLLIMRLIMSDFGYACRPLIISRRKRGMCAILYTLRYIYYSMCPDDVQFFIT